MLAVHHLSVGVDGRGASFKVVRDLSFEVAAGRTLCLVGESGSGKTMTALALMRLLPEPLRAQAQVVTIDGVVVELGSQRGPPLGLAMIFQEPMTALNPAFAVGHQIIEALNIHQGLAGAPAKAEAIRLLDEVGITAAAARFSAFPHQLSGGMRQRVMIAMALACAPRFLIADEPTTALDVTVQAQIIRLFKQLQAQHGLGMILVTHDMGVVSLAGDDVAVMYAGQIVEYGSVGRILEDPKHPYTQALLACMPTMPDEANLVPEPPARLAEIAGIVPPPTDWNDACTFAARCQFARDECHARAPLWVDLRAEHRVACWLYNDQNCESPNV
jgi:peptide/nickel transport system ATP-binding protein